MSDYYKKRISELDKKLKEEFIDDKLKIDLLELELFRIEKTIKDKLKMIKELEDNIFCLENAYHNFCCTEEEEEEELRFRDLLRRAREIKC
ncbi:hypothetical protein AB4407_20620 [Vibrio sp. 10N.261.46.E11]|jgi:hypothetical protein|uniref:hypothetical protein n=1 Tax=Vibrio sp. 10N.261.46.E11 TaxID=3229662 RepID=UPI00355101B8